MRSSLRVASIVFVGLLGFAIASAKGEKDSFDGNVLLAQCEIVIRMTDAGTDEAEMETLNAGMCLGYVDGVRDANDAFDVLKGSRLFCIPRNSVTTGQLVRVVVEYLRSHPSELHNLRGVLTLAAFNNAFPCSESAPKKKP